MPINFLTITDPHFAGVGPKAYLPNPAAYKQDQLSILAECADLAKENNCAAVLMPGDLTNSHIMSTAVLREFAEALKKFPCPVLTVAGNHDRETSNLEDLKAAPYGVLEATGVIWDVSKKTYNRLISGWVAMRELIYPQSYSITGHPYTEDTDHDIEQYTISERIKDYTNIHLTHGALIPDHPWYIVDKESKTDREGRKHRYTTFEELALMPKEKLPDIIINGHNHLGHEATYLPNGTLITNYGSIAHLSRDVGEIKRVPKVGLVTISGPGQDGKINYKAIPIVLKSQRPGHECLDREELVRELERAKTKDKMGEYLGMLGTKREIRTRDAKVVVVQAVGELGAAKKFAGGVDEGVLKERCLRRLDKVSGAMEAKEEGAITK